MANTKSAAKRSRQTPVRTARNRAVKTGVKTKVKAARTAIATGDKTATTGGLSEAYAELDRAVKRGVIHKNTANRRKGRLNKAAAPALA